MKDFSVHVNQYLAYCTQHKTLDQKTTKAYRIDLDQFLHFSECQGNLPLKETVLKYIAYLNRTYKPRSAKRKTASLKAFYTYLKQEAILEESPFDRIRISFREPLHLPRIIPHEYLHKLFHAVYQQVHQQELHPSQYKKSVRDAAVIELLFATGLRVSELCNLTDASINCSEGIVRIYGKGKKERIMHIENSSVLNILSEYRALFLTEISNCGHFFVNRNGMRLSEQSVRLIVNRCVDLANIPLHITPHMFRHSFATLLLEADVDIRYIQSFLGHSSIKTTEIYTKVSTHKQREIFAAKHPRNKIYCT